MFRTAVFAATLAAALLAGCDMLGIESPEKLAAARDAEGRAIGGACRHAGRAIEDCYALNRRTDKAAIFAGWRDMNDYMRENKIEEVPPTLVAHAASPKSTDPKPGEAKSAEVEEPAVKGKPRDAKGS
ncbi:hypothetical protein BURC_04180 [Burkholderiaceae bacterium]|nr:hypothetical protein BURC_04180 [Burkholderiaceae bacterium]